MTRIRDFGADGPSGIVIAALWLAHPWLRSMRAISSVGERFVHTEEVRGSKPRSPTIITAGQSRFRGFRSRLFRCPCPPSCPHDFESEADEW